MKFILRPFWNYLIGLRNGYYPNILCENIGQYPMKFWCSLLWLYRRNNHDFAIVYIDDILDEEISYEEYLLHREEYLKMKNEWYQKKFAQNHSKTKQRILKFHYWINDIN